MEVDTIVGISNNQVMEIPRFDLEFFLFLRSFVDGAVGKGEAMALYWTLEAVGVLGNALEGTELHHGLVVTAWAFAVEE